MPASTACSDGPCQASPENARSIWSRILLISVIAALPNTTSLQDKPRARHKVADEIARASSLLTERNSSNWMYKSAGKPRSKILVGVEQNRDGPIVHELERHVRLKDTGLDAHAKRPQRAHKFLVERFPQFRRRRVDEAGAALAARVAVQRELRDGERRAARIEERPVHFPLVVAEDP